MAIYNQEQYIESTKAVLKEYLKSIVTNTDFPIALPDIGSDTLDLSQPALHIEFSRSFNIDEMFGRNNGKGQNVKRKRLTFNIQIVTTGENSAVLERDRIAQKIETEMAKRSTSQWFAQRQLQKVECRHMNSYRVREGVHLCRLEVFLQIKITE